MKSTKKQDKEKLNLTFEELIKVSVEGNPKPTKKKKRKAKKQNL
jgi:hypothetical protein